MPKQKIDSKDLILQLKNILDKFGIDSQDVTRIIGYIRIKEINKGDCFCTKGKTCNEVGVLFGGLLMAHFDNEKKDFNISRFFFAPHNIIVASFESFRNQKPSNENILALENSSLACISFKNLNLLYEQIPSLNKLGRLFAEESYVMALQRIHDLQTLNAEQRVIKFYRSNKKLYNRAQKQHLASYLRVNRNDLAKIISEYHKK